MDIGDVFAAGGEDGKGDAEGHSSDDEYRVDGTGHSGGNIAVDDVACRVDDWKSGNEKDGAGNECVPHGAASK